ncbi:isopenicillin N synthase family dioxygenase [Aquimarina sediminis]|uniref:isopenicillin N synthase family dioxygenase n=1 Tax=Aquimarina sediminis TaxID=2070536 RepID=UPI000CA08775|nr:2-oxoglutarate and iron-dependent oxygenase domain-containing protein [Aquimarina sediminis]
MDKNSIKRVDYLDFVSKDLDKRNQFIKDFGDSFSNMGFAIVANHGVSVELKKKLYETAKSFFSLSDGKKMKFQKKESSGQRGYIAKNIETAKGRKVPDLKEFYHIGQETDRATLSNFGYPQNVWPDTIPGFKKYGIEVFNTLEKTGKNLLKAIALYLNLPENYFDDKIENGNSILRLLHYYPLNESDLKNPQSVRAAAHGDINLITLLMGANADGLQAQTLAGDWLDVKPAPDEIVINVGDMLARLTNDKLRSTIHRVINPTDLNKLKTSRYSMPFFLHPNPNMDLTCLESCISSENPKKYEDITSGEFLNERLVELGLKK